MTRAGGQPARPRLTRESTNAPRRRERHRSEQGLQAWVAAQIENAPPITDEQARVVQRVLGAFTLAESIAATIHPARHTEEFPSEVG